MPTIDELENMMNSGMHPEIHPDGSVTSAKEELDKKMKALQDLINDKTANQNKELMRFAFFDGFMSALRLAKNKDWNYDLHDAEIEFNEFWNNRKDGGDAQKSSCNPPPQGESKKDV